MKRLFLFCLLLTWACTPSNPDPERLKEADTRYLRGDIDAALDLYREILNDHPGHARTAIMASKALYYKQEFDEAESLLNEACTADDTSVDCLLWLAKVRAVAPEKHEQAMRVLDELLERDSSHIEAWTLKGQLLEDQDRVPEAIDAYRYAVAESKKAARAHLRLSLLYKKHGMLSRSQADYRRALQLSVDDPELTERIQSAYQKQ